ncbi:hypothetical protein SNEBB_007263 [Seison nebaliae]|nr:hypothetical protein SNEBB_007263 [Seison nebaliae]
MATAEDLSNFLRYEPSTSNDFQFNDTINSDMLEVIQDFGRAGSGDCGPCPTDMDCELDGSIPEPYNAIKQHYNKNSNCQCERKDYVTLDEKYCQDLFVIKYNLDFYSLKKDEPTPSALEEQLKALLNINQDIYIKVNIDPKPVIISYGGEDYYRKSAGMIFGSPQSFFSQRVTSSFLLFEQLIKDTVTNKRTVVENGTSSGEDVEKAFLGNILLSPDVKALPITIKRVTVVGDNENCKVQTQSGECIDYCNGKYVNNECVCSTLYYGENCDKTYLPYILLAAFIVGFMTLIGIPLLAWRRGKPWKNVVNRNRSVDLSGRDASSNFSKIMFGSNHELYQNYDEYFTKEDAERFEKLNTVIENTKNIDPGTGGVINPMFLTSTTNFLTIPKIRPIVRKEMDETNPNIFATVDIKPMSSLFGHVIKGNHNVQVPELPMDFFKLPRIKLSSDTEFSLPSTRSSFSNNIDNNNADEDEMNIFHLNNRFFQQNYKRWNR